MFGSRVCVKCTGVRRRGKLDCCNFTGIFLGYTALDHNIWYLDLESGIVKETHHATFDEAWYMQPSQPPAAQLLYNLGLEADESQLSEIGPVPTMDIAHYPLMPHVLVEKQKWGSPAQYLHAPLPLRGTEQPRQWAAAAARTFIPADDALVNVNNIICNCAQVTALDIANEYNIGHQFMEMVYISPNLYYHESFDELVDWRPFDLSQHAQRVSLSTRRMDTLFLYT